MAVAWAKKGKASQEALEKERLRQEKEREFKSRLWGFHLKAGETARITFVDGDVDEEGLLDTITYREHAVQKNAEFEKYVCIADSEPCPLCEDGHKSSFKCALTIIDHRNYTSKKTGEVIGNTRRLFVFPPKTQSLLQKLATKYGGLAGVTFEVSRSTENDPAVGDTFMYECKTDLEELKTKYIYTVETTDDEGNPMAIEVNPFEVADYETQLPYLPAEELRKLGFGNKVVNHKDTNTTKANTVQSSATKVTKSAPATKEDNFDDQL